MDDITWQTPPTPKRGPHSLDPILEALRANPGRWALVSTSDRRPNGRQQYLKNHYGFEATSRVLPDGSFALYARAPKQVAA